jgi:hypothetical protein
MSNAAIDQNSRQTGIARLKTDGVSLLRLTADPSSQALSVTTDTTGATVPSNFSGTDENGRISWFTVSEDDATQLVALQCDVSGALLIKMI